MVMFVQVGFSQDLKSEDKNSVYVTYDLCY